jgi:hypothetical protein
VQGTISTVKFTQAEVPVAVRCDIHPWMSAFLCVVEHPYWAVTDAEGKFGIPNLPAGIYTFGVWHEGLATLDGKNEIPLVVKANQTVEFVMKKK